MKILSSAQTMPRGQHVISLRVLVNIRLLAEFMNTNVRFFILFFKTAACFMVLQCSRCGLDASSHSSRAWHHSFLLDGFRTRVVVVKLTVNPRCFDDSPQSHQKNNGTGWRTTGVSSELIWVYLPEESWGGSWNLSLYLLLLSPSCFS